MGAEKIVKINSEHEADMLRERVNTLESVITYSVAEQTHTIQKKKLRQAVKSLGQCLVILLRLDAILSLILELS